MRGQKTDTRTNRGAGQGESLETLGREVSRAVEELAALTRSWWPPKTVRRRIIRAQAPEILRAEKKPGGNR